MKVYTQQEKESEGVLNDHRAVTGSDIGDKRAMDVNVGVGARADAFGRLRVSDTGQRLDVEFIYDKQDSFFDEITNNGTVTHNANTRDLTLSLSDAANGSYAEMRSHPVPYTPGNSQLIDMTGVPDLAGIGTGTMEVFLRSKITGTAVIQENIEEGDAEWLDTASPDWSTSHIFSVDFQSLKVGTIRFFRVTNGAPVHVASIHNDNLRDSGYWQLASMPVRYKLYTEGGITYAEFAYGDDNNSVGFRYKLTANASATMKAICCTVKSEGGNSLKDMEGLPRCIDNGVTEKTVSTTLIPLLSIRPKSTFQSLDNLGIAIPKGITVTASNPIKLVVIHDGVLTDENWNDVDATDSMMEYDDSATAITGGHTVYADYITTSKNNDIAGQGLLGKTVLWVRQSTVSGILTIAAIKTGTSDSDSLSALRWIELR